MAKKKDGLDEDEDFMRSVRQADAEKQYFKAVKGEADKSIIQDIKQDTAKHARVEFEKESKIAQESDLAKFKKDLQVSHFDSEKKAMQRVSQGAGKEIRRTATNLGRVTPHKNIDPLAGMRRTVKKKGKRGRPRKYKEQRPTERRVGRPRDVNFSLSGRPVFSNERMMGQVPRRFTPEPEREPFVPPTSSQLLMQEVLGSKNQTWGFGGNPVRINRKLSSGTGLTNADAAGDTSSFFGGWRR